MKITSFALALLLVIFTSDAQTIKHKSIYGKQKTFEIGGDIMLNSSEYYRDQISIGNESSSSTVVNFIVDGTAGIFVINWLKLAVEPAIQLSFYESNTWTRTKIYFSPEYILNMKSKIIYPYLGGAVGYTSESFSGSDLPNRGGFSWGLKGGVKINAFGNALINLGISYYRETYNYLEPDPYLGDIKQHYNILGVKAGLSIFFR